MDWFVSVRDEDADVLVYRGGRGFDQGSVIEQVIAAGQACLPRGRFGCRNCRESGHRWCFTGSDSVRRPQDQCRADS